MGLCRFPAKSCWWITRSAVARGCTALLGLSLLLLAPPALLAGKNRGKPGTSAVITPPPSNAQLADTKLNARVDALLGKMTLQEKIGQLTQYSLGEPTGPGARQQDAQYLEMIARGEVGAIANATGAARVNLFQHAAMEKSRLHIPLIFGFDVIHGERSVFPVPLGLAASFDPVLVERMAHLAATESRADGVDLVFSPMVDISRDARWGRIVEGAGEDPVLGNAIARAYIRGYQQGDLGNSTSVVACVKHFAAYGAPVAGRDYAAVDMSEITLRQIYLPPYHAAIDEGAAAVMSSFNSLNGVPATASHFLQTEVLRGEWGFDGFVMSDWQAVQELIPHGVAGDGTTAARKAITAGVDVDGVSDLYRTHLAALVQSGELSADVVNEAARRVLRVKFALGLFDHPYADETLPAYVATPEKRAQVRVAAEESFVLLKNEPIEGVGRLLPLARGVKKVALIGPLADSGEEMLGTWTANGNPQDVATLRSALAARLQERLIFSPGTDFSGRSDAGFAAAVEAARHADVVILALGEQGTTMSGEASSRTSLGLPGNQQQLLEQIAATGKPIVLVLFNGRPLALPWAAKHVPAILEAWYPGMEAGPALANVLFGDANPSGKLPVEMARSVGQEPLYYAQLPTGRPAPELDYSRLPANPPKRYDSSYIDEGNTPLFPFGWGLSYTNFQYSAIRVSHEASADNAIGTFHVSAYVTNTGTIAGTEVAQLYIRDAVASVEQPERELKGFRRVTLAQGESRHLEFNLGFEDLAFYNADLKRVVEPGHFDVWIGGNSLATQQAGLDVVGP